MTELKDNIDFGSESIPQLFRRFLYPTLAGMIFAILFNIVDGVFVGRFIGSDALASVNIAAPIFMFCTGVSLMLGMGGSVVASIHLSRGKVKTARIVTTQSVLSCFSILLIISVLVMCFKEPVLRMFGCTDRLMSLSSAYLSGYVPFLAVNGVFLTGEFFIRLNGSPRFAMAISILTSVLNIILDAVFIIILQMGTFGAAIATGISMTLGGAVTAGYLLVPSVELRMIRLKVHVRAMKLYFRNLGYMSRLGFPTFIGEMAIAFMLVVGNHVFGDLAGETALAAFSVSSYMMPVVFMIFGAISQSAQPIISFNYGADRPDRVRKAYSVSLRHAIGVALILTAGAELLAPMIVKMFIIPSDPAFSMGISGLRLISLAILPFAFNMMQVCMSQSVEMPFQGSLITLLRGFVLLLACFLTLPAFFKLDGAWLALPCSELLTLVVALAITVSGKGPMRHINHD